VSPPSDARLWRWWWWVSGYDLPDSQFGQVSLQQFQQLASQHIVVLNRQRETTHTRAHTRTLRAARAFFPLSLSHTHVFADKLEQALLCFDSTGSGWVPVQTLGYVLQQYGERLTPQEFQALQQDCQVQQGQINARAAAARLTFKP
jgi:hypothetical protein